MAVHSTPNQTPDSIGDRLLTTFAVALVIAIVPIVAVGLLETTVALVAALGTIVAFTAGIVWLLGRMIGPEDHPER
jgi:uncharacterized membrane protein